MNHQQILDKLAARYLVQSIDDDVEMLTNYAMYYAKLENMENELVYILPKLLRRWNCIFNAGEEVAILYKHKVTLALVVTLHKYGFADKSLSAKALKAIDKLSKNVVLSDAFFRQSDEIKEFPGAPPQPVKQKPSMPDSITFYRTCDVVSIEQEGKFYAAYIHALTGPNESPIIEFYDRVFDYVPEIDEIETIAFFAVHGMKFLPVLANQIHLIGAYVESKPINSHLAPPVGRFSISNLFQMQSDIQEIFDLNGK